MVKQGIPISQIALDMQIFKRSDAVFRLVFGPDIRRQKIEILSVDMNVVFVDQAVDQGGQKGSGFRIAQIKEGVRLAFLCSSHSGCNAAR